MTRGYDPQKKGMGPGQRKRNSRHEPWKLESDEVAKKWELVSIRRLLMAIQSNGDPGFKSQARNVLGRLEAALEGDPEAVTLASRMVMRKVRKPWVQHAGKLVRASKGHTISFGALLPRHLELTEEEFEAFDAEAEKKAFKSFLNRRGIAKHKGWLIAVLHGEYDSFRKLWRVHWHILACHEMIKVIDGLRTEPDFKKSKRERPRVRRSREPLVNIPRIVSYLLQAWWPNRPSGKFGDAPKEGRTDHRMGIVGLPHARWLIWMDGRKLSDLVMLVGLRRTTSGFKMTQL
ncbi:hypothetical protein [Novosphingobium sp. CECT 9465]|uniref:hypothetical protein n=1 Tax=Novosphingobium sp. CECT 9465 TaxID=2829794 RepID=UPI001E29CD88|nr:hypothetical protein [Novosphingobium sp. CECT 9465]CAH0497220.1 hypothetical protein NVSP9465_02272 [Novosphingobium sp. CECT 9465]